MKFYINTLNDNGSGMKYNTKEEFLHEISLMIDDCIANGGTFFDVQVDSDVSCFYNPCEDEDENEDEIEEFDKQVEAKREDCPYGHWKNDYGYGFYCEYKKSFVTPYECSKCKIEEAHKC
jgi:hypothetical protein